MNDWGAADPRKRINDVSRSSRFAEALGCAIFLIGVVFFCLANAIDLPADHMDGAFQTASGLYRLHEGQRFGRDFYPYLGIGPILSIYPAFALSGAHLAASVFASTLMTIVFSWIAVSVIHHLLFQPDRLGRSFLVGALFIAAVVATFSFSVTGLQRLQFAAHPGNSLRPIRSALPYAVALCVYLALVRAPLRHRWWIMGCATGGALLWSNDYALPTAGLFSALGIFFILTRADRKARSIAEFLGAMAATAVLLFWIATAGHPLDLLRYNFIDVARDQWWYFATYDENTRIFALSDLPKLLSKDKPLPILVLIALLVVALWTRRAEHLLLLCVGLAVMAGGLLASIGGHLGKYYFSATTFFALTVTILAVVRGAQQGVTWAADRSGLIHRFHWPSGLPGWADSLTCIVLAIFLGGNVLTYATEKTEASVDPGRFMVPELGGYLGTDWEGYVTLARTTPGVVLEEYWGLWSAVRRSEQPWPVDSIIHALGRQRTIAREALQHADIVITTSQSGSPQWQPWNLTQNFWFHDHMLSHWEPVRQSPMTTVWQRRQQALSWPKVRCDVDGTTLRLPDQQTGFYRLQIAFSHRAAGRSLLMLRQNLSFIGESDGYASLDPHGTEAMVPVFLAGPETAFDLKPVGNPPGVASIQSCTAWKLQISDPEILTVPRFFRTDDTWDKGVSLTWPGFMVPNTTSNRRAFAVDLEIELANGDRRRILRSQPFNEYLFVQVDGTILDPTRAGYPDQYRPVQAD